MASRQTMWIGAGLLARLLMIAFLLMSVHFNLANHTSYTYMYINDYTTLQSYKYAVASAILGLVGSMLQIPVAIYLLCKSKRTIPSGMILGISMHADIVISIVLGSGVGAGFGATNDALQYARNIKWLYAPWEQDVISYYNRGIIATVFLFIGMLLSICATVVSARLRDRAMNDPEAV